MKRLLPFLLIPIAFAQAESIPSEPLPKTQYIRALSLDLRGVAPDVEDYERSPEALVDEWLQTEAFADQVVRRHRDFLWPNVSDIRLLSNRQRLKYDDGLWYRYLVAPHYRGGPIHCGDWEATYDDDGQLILQENADGTVQEGWLWVTPYWDIENPIKMCAFGAQEAEVSPYGTECDTYDGRYDPYCGCGPDLAWCDIPEIGHNGGNPNPPVASAIARDAELRVKRVIENDLSYLEILTGRTAFVNGPLVHFYTYQTRVPAHVRFNELPVDPDLLPDIPFGEHDTWMEVELGPEQSGILTSPLYLMKFQTRRGRVNRFFNAFLCQPFQPPAGGLTNLDESVQTLDLTEREGCRYCHAIIEPAGAHWGRWGEYGAGYLSPQDYPEYDDECAWCAQTGESCSSVCERYYVTDPISSEEDPYVGWLKSYEFLEERHFTNAEVGPQLLVNQGVVDGRLPTCVATRTAEWLLGREVREDEEAWVGELSGNFAANDFRYDLLVRDIVLSDTYRVVH